MSAESLPSPAEIERILDDCGLEVPPGLAAGVRRYLGILRQWNRQINLTGRQTATEQVRLHFAEAFFAAARLSDEDSQLLDVGSGAGFPGLAMKLYRPALRVLLLEPRLKRASFLWTVKRELGLSGVEVLNQNLDSWLAETRPGPPRLWSLRAVANVASLLERAGAKAPERLLLFWTRRRATPDAAGWHWRRPELIPWSREKVLLWGERESGLNCST